MRKSFFLAVLMLASTFAKADLLINGGFESGDFTGWTVAGSAGTPSITTSPVSEGVYAATVAVSESGFVTIDQSFATTVGEHYIVHFDLMGTGTTELDVLNESVWFGDQSIMNSTGLPQSPYVARDIFVTADDTMTDLSFMFGGSGLTWYLDNVSVTVGTPPTDDVPEPASLLLLAMGLPHVLRKRLRQQQ